jgi:hypothetical protein
VKRQGPVGLTKTCEPLEISKGGETECVITATNTSFESATIHLRDRIPEELEVTTVSGASGRRILTFDGDLAGAEPPNVTAAVQPLVSPAGYLPLALFGGNLVVPSSDESIVNVGIPAFEYASESWSTIGVVSNGYIVVGGGTGEDVDFQNTNFPNGARPNNVLAPCWTDLNPTFGGRILVNVLTDGVNNWTIVEWERVANFTDRRRNTCQVWIGAAANGAGQDITCTYGPDITTGDGGLMTVGAENRFGNRGNSVFFNGTGSAPTPTNTTDYEVIVTSSPGAPGETHTVTFTAKGVKSGKWQNCAAMGNDFTFGTTFACVDGEVTRSRR